MTRLGFAERSAPGTRTFGLFRHGQSRQSRRYQLGFFGRWTVLWRTKSSLCGPRTKHCSALSLMTTDPGDRSSPDLWLWHGLRRAEQVVNADTLAQGCICYGRRRGDGRWPEQARARTDDPNRKEEFAFEPGAGIGTGGASQRRATVHIVYLLAARRGAGGWRGRRTRGTADTTCGRRRASSIRLAAASTS